MRRSLFVALTFVMTFAAVTHAQECEGDDVDPATFCPEDVTPLDGNVAAADYQYCRKMNPAFVLFYNSDTGNNFDSKWQATMPNANSGWSSLAMGKGATSAMTLYIVAQNAPTNYDEYGEHTQVVKKATNRDSDAGRNCNTGTVMTCSLKRGAGTEDLAAGRVAYTHDTKMGMAWGKLNDGTNTATKHNNYGSTNILPCNPNTANGFIGGGGGIGAIFGGGTNFLIVASTVAAAFLIVGMGIYYRKKQEQQQGAYFDHGGYASQWSGTNESYSSSRSGGRSKGSRSRSKGSRSKGSSHGRSRGSSSGKRSHSKSRGHHSSSRGHRR